uniref:Glycosyltransferase family 92 protein n=1 Tax=Cynoglossus semilaevis TaxID=244447 RepID=A0A3P8UYA6_CYNSE
MTHTKDLRGKLLLLFTVTFLFVTVFIIRSSRMVREIPNPSFSLKACHVQVSEQPITPLQDTQHLLVSAYMDQRVKGFDVRIISIFKRDSVHPLHCIFCCSGDISTTTPANILPHSDHFGFPYGTTDVMCQIPLTCHRATHVSLLTEPNKNISTEQLWLPIRRTAVNEKEKLQFNFTVCISNLFGEYNNVLQVAQSLEMYRLLGVGRVVIYNTSCGPELDLLLQTYSQEGFLEIVPWPIDKYLIPSKGWSFSIHGGDLHYYGQLATLNDCIYRSMARSHYVTLNDIDEIVMPYQHDNLADLMSVLQQHNPNTGVFLIENHIFPKIYFEPGGRFHLSQWKDVPGVNILEHIYRETPDMNIYHPYKIIVQPRMVEQTSVHSVLKTFGQVYKVPHDVCRLIHTRVALRVELTLEQLNVDKRLWDFHEKLIPNVDKVLRRAGLLSSEGQS